ncbi:hypothetical protein WJX73_000764 [Symbiochloris irregularis]|uniref:Uncharacterized protein n=1 Tax=Symbiochloris irregularis TaxID=706552 RepID=A0AAW1PF21_9CHLO
MVHFEGSSNARLQRRVSTLEKQLAQHHCVIALLEQRMQRLECSNVCPPGGLAMPVGAGPQALMAAAEACTAPSFAEPEESMSVDSPTAAKENHPPIPQTTPGSKRRAVLGPSPLRRSSQDLEGHTGEGPASVRRKTAQRSLAFGKNLQAEHSGAAPSGSSSPRSGHHRTDNHLQAETSF